MVGSDTPCSLTLRLKFIVAVLGAHVGQLDIVVQGPVKTKR